MQDRSWVEHTAQEVSFVVEALQLQGRERILDLACGFGRHVLELARMGYSAVGVDVTAEFIAKARKRARDDCLEAEFICADLREVFFQGEFDIVLNLADGAIGYLENDKENLRIFDLIASALKPGGKHLMGVCNATYASRHFPRRHWEMGSRSISLAEFDWDAEKSRMLYTGYHMKYSEPLTKPKPEGHVNYIRLYTLEELDEIFRARGMQVRQAYGDYDTATTASDDSYGLVVYSQKLGTQSI